MGLDYPHYDWEEIGGVVSPAVLNHPDMRIHHLLIKTCVFTIYVNCWTLKLGLSNFSSHYISLYLFYILV